MRNIKLYPGAGKTEVEFERLTTLSEADQKPASRQRESLVYVSTREEVESMDLGRPACSFGPKIDKKEGRLTLRRISLTISGYEDDVRELYEIPEVRRFYSVAFECCPAFIPAADLRNDCLRMVVLCALKNLRIIRRLVTDRPQVCVDPVELERFFTLQFTPQAALGLRLGWSTKRSVKEMEHFRNYLKIDEQ